MPRLTDPFATPIEDDDIETRAAAIAWTDDAGKDNSDDARNYLGLITGKKNAQRIVDNLDASKLTSFKAKDILRAAGLDPLPASDVRVQLALQLIAAGTPLAPVYLVRGKMGRGIPLTIADGYHRTSAAWSIEPGTDIPAFITSA